MQTCHVVPLKNILLYREATNAIIHVFHSSFQLIITSNQRSTEFEETFRTITSSLQSSMYAVLLSTTPPFVWNICQVNNIKEFCHSLSVSVDVFFASYHHEMNLHSSNSPMQHQFPCLRIHTTSDDNDIINDHSHLRRTSELSPQRSRMFY